MHEWVHCRDEAADHQLPTAAAFWIIRIVSAMECSSLTQNLVQICNSTCSVTLNAMAKQYTCPLNCVYRPHWLVEWSHHCPHMRTPVHSPWLPGYINVLQTVLVILTVVGLFLDRPPMCPDLGSNLQPWTIRMTLWPNELLGQGLSVFHLMDPTLCARGDIITKTSLWFILPLPSLTPEHSIVGPEWPGVINNLRSVP